MTFERVKIENKWYNDLRDEPEGCWYDSNRGIYLVPDILVDAIENGFDSIYSHLVGLSNDHSEVFSDEYQDVRDIMLLDEWIYEEFERFEQWINDSELFLIPENMYIGMQPDTGDFGMHRIDEDDSI